MGLPGYALTQPSQLSDLTLFPTGFLYESDTKGTDESIIRNVTQRGVITEYELYHQEVKSYVFQLSSTQYSTIETFLSATRATDFYFVPDSSSVGTYYHCRRSPSSMPKAQAPARYSGTMEQRFSWTLTIQVLVTDDALED